MIRLGWTRGAGPVAHAGSGGVRKRTDGGRAGGEGGFLGRKGYGAQNGGGHCHYLPRWNSPISSTLSGCDVGTTSTSRRLLATTAATTTGRFFLYHRCSPAVMPSGEDTRLYNYGVPVIGRSKLRFPAPREQEYAARARRAALRQI